MVYLENDSTYIQRVYIPRDDEPTAATTGHTFTLQRKDYIVTENGTIRIHPDAGYDGISGGTIGVYVSAATGVTPSHLNVTENGLYVPTGNTMYSGVTVNVLTGGTINNQSKSVVLSTGDTAVTVTYDSGYTGLESVEITKDYQLSEQENLGTITTNGEQRFTLSAYTNNVQFDVAVDTGSTYQEGYRDGYASGYTSGETHQRSLLSSTTITANSKTVTSETGWSGVTVDINLGILYAGEVTQNGHYVYSIYDFPEQVRPQGWRQVEFDVNTSGAPTSHVNITITSNAFDELVASNFILEFTKDGEAYGSYTLTTSGTITCSYEPGRLYSFKPVVMPTGFYAYGDVTGTGITRWNLDNSYTFNVLKVDDITGNTITAMTSNGSAATFTRFDATVQTGATRYDVYKPIGKEWNDNDDYWELIFEGTVVGADGYNESPTETYQYTKFIFPEGVETLHRFRFFTGLTDVIATSVTTISGECFDNCYSLTGVTTPSVEDIGRRSFYECYALQSINIPNATTIGWEAFARCTGLTSVTAGSMTSINYMGFYDCSALTRIDLSTVETIGNYAFANCRALSGRINLNNIKTIQLNAFQSCSNVTSVTIGGNCTYLNSYVFAGTSSMTELIFLGNTPPDTVASTFVNMGGEYPNGTVYIPSGTTSAYSTIISQLPSGWTVVEQ